MSLQILKGGIYTTIQDSGRYGSQKYGVTVGGAMDITSYRIANMLIGNHEYEATIEITLIGTCIKFDEACLIAITGGNLHPTLDDKPVPMWKPFIAEKEQTLQFNTATVGCRAYLAVAGGIDVPEVMGSKSTYIRASIGGYEGRQLQKGDTLQPGLPNKRNKQIQTLCHNEDSYLNWSVHHSAFLSYESPSIIRILKGAQYELFDKISINKICSSPYTITTSADRMGYRLDGDTLQTEKQIDQLSEGVTFGTIQVPSNGLPIILMADRQTTGGYPKIGQVITADLPKLSQMKPNDVLYFQFVTIEEAETLLFQIEEKISELKQGLNFKVLQNGSLIQ